MVANLGTSCLIRSRGLRDKPTHVQFDSIGSEKSCNKKHFTNTLHRDRSPVFVELYDHLPVSEQTSGSKTKHNCPQLEQAVMKKWARLERNIQRVIAS